MSKKIYNQTEDEIGICSLVMLYHV